MLEDDQLMLVKVLKEVGPKTGEFGPEGGKIRIRGIFLFNIKHTSIRIPAASILGLSIVNAALW